MPTAFSVCSTGPPEVRPDISLHYRGGDAPAAGFDLRLVPKLRAALGRFDPAVVVAHGGDPLKYLVPAMVTQRRPLAYYAIGTYAGQPRRRQLLLWRRLVARTDVVAAEGDEVRAECISLLGMPPERVVMTPNGRDPDVFHPRTTSPATSPMVTFVGALNDGKGPDRFVRMVARLRGSGFTFRAQAIGDGPLRGALAGPAQAARVELLGSRSDVAELLRESDIMVFPSRPAGEGMPGVLIEAGLSGVPVVACDVPGVHTVLSDGETGLVVAPDDRVGPGGSDSTSSVRRRPSLHHGKRGPCSLPPTLHPGFGGAAVVGPTVTTTAGHHPDQELSSGGRENRSDRVLSGVESARTGASGAPVRRRWRPAVSCGHGDAAPTGTGAAAPWASGGCTPGRGGREARVSAPVR